MSELSAADQYLIAEIRRGNADGWAQLVDRYQGRLLAFARQQLRNPSECEDVVQETFLSFLQSVAKYREDASLETYLFMLVRRRIVDYLRRQGRISLSSCSLQESLADEGADLPRVSELADRQDEASEIMMERERHKAQLQALHAAIKDVVQGLQTQERFRDLQVVELIFYAQLRNKQIAELLQMDEKQVALRKHRMIERLGQRVGREGDASHVPLDDSLLTQAWEQLRPSCPKRTTLGKLVLGALDGPWKDYIQFHVHELGCRFCQANLADVQLEAQPDRPDPARQRILQSSIGFFRPESRLP
ncbi:MAG: sigma-70 family RNA polymerase sigma factor [Pirellulales bacterium]